MSKSFNIKGFVFKIISEQLSGGYTVVEKEEFKDALLDLATLSLEDDQVRYPKFDNENKSYLFGGSNYDLFVLNRDELPERGPFEIIIEQDDDVIGFMRGAKKANKTISFNLIHIKDEYRGNEIGTDIYEEFLNDGYTIKSDKEITDSTYSVYLKLLSYGYKPIIFDDGTVGLLPKTLLPITESEEKKYIRKIIREEVESLADSLNLKSHKKKQLDLILRTNPMLDDYHTGIRTLSDIKTLEEIVYSDDDNFLITTPDFDIDDAKDAVKAGFITVFSSRPIKKGTFVTPSPIIAKSYSGDGRIYSKKTNIYNIAWIDLSEGMFAPVSTKTITMSSN